MKECQNPKCDMNTRERTFADKVNFCENCGGKLEEVTTPIEHTMYLHGCKESNYEKAEEMSLSESACETFAYTLYELPVVVKTNPSTGVTKMIGVKDHGQTIYLQTPVEV